MKPDNGDFDGRLYTLSYKRPDGTVVPFEPVGSKRVAARALSSVFTLYEAGRVTPRHRHNVTMRLENAPLGTNIHDHVTGYTFRIDVTGQLPTYEKI